jgi:hypothetical protein
VVTQPWRRFPSNPAPAIHVPHGISGCFEFNEHFGRNQVAGSMGVISPEAGGFESLIGVFRKNLVHCNLHHCFEVGSCIGKADVWKLANYE